MARLSILPPDIFLIPAIAARSLFFWLRRIGAHMGSPDNPPSWVAHLHLEPISLPAPRPVGVALLVGGLVAR